MHKGWRTVGWLLVSVIGAACGSSNEGTAGPYGNGGAGHQGGAGGAAASSANAGTSGFSGGSGGSGGATDAAADGPTCATASDEVTAAPVDIIITIDQSPSMAQEKDGVKANLNTNLVQILEASNIDYRVIFVTGFTDLPTGPNYFQASANVNSSDTLTLLLWTYDGFNKSPNTCEKKANAAVQWKDKLRYGSFKVFIALTDDDPSSFDCANATATCTSDCAGCANNCSGWCPMFQCPTFADKAAAWGGSDFPTELYKLLPAGTFGTAQAPQWVMHSIVPVQQQLDATQPVTGLHDVCNENGNTGETSGVEYQKLSILTGGIRFPSCNTDYSPVFQKIASTIVPLACKFNLESTNLGKTDPDKTNVVYTPGNGGDPETFFKDDTAPCDSGANGWQFVDNNTAVVLCGAACDKVKADSKGKVQITVGCDTKVAPPK